MRNKGVSTSVFFNAHTSACVCHYLSEFIVFGKIAEFLYNKIYSVSI